MVPVFRIARSGFRRALLIAALVAYGAPFLSPQAAAQTAVEAYASRDSLVRAGLEANRKTLEAVVEFAIALEGAWNEKMAGSAFQPTAAGAIPDKSSSLNVAVRAGLQDLNRSIDRAVRLQTEASSTRDGKLALMLATDAASWTNRALYAAQELRVPLVRHVAVPVPTTPGTAGGAGTVAKSGTTDPVATGAPRPKTASGLPVGPPQNIAALNRYLDQLSGRVGPTSSDNVGGPQPGRPARNLNELSQRLDELSGRTTVVDAGPPGNEPRPTGSPPRNMLELSRYLDQLSGKAETSHTWDAPPPPAAMAIVGSRFATNLTGLFQHLDELSGTNPIQADLDFVQRNAQGEFSQGRAGAGGISLFKAAELVSPLPLDKVQGVAWRDQRLTLRLADRDIEFPPLDPEYLAQSVRCVYDGEGTYEGQLVADESNAIVVQTGRTRFGELVWRKQFLTTPWVSVPKGSNVRVELGPGLGLLAELAPSTDRVTYYGPIKNTRMGKVLLESDQVISLLYHGVDPRTGQPARPALDGFQTFFERNVRKMLELAVSKNAQPTPSDGQSKTSSRQWWTDATWMVWVPDRFALRLTEDGKRFEFAETRMKLDTWMVGEGPVSDQYAGFGGDVTAHYDDLAKQYPALKELKEVAKAVCVTRWLKQQKVAFDQPDWAKTYPIKNIDTPATVRRFAVEPVLRFEKGLPIPAMDKGNAP
jgi:hypothetical protein